MSANTIKTTQKYRNLCKNENKSLVSMYYQYHVRKHNKNNTETRTHTPPPQKKQCALMHTRYQVYKEKTGVKLPTLTVRGDLSIHPAYGEAPLFLSQRYGYTHHGYTMHIQKKQHTMEFSNIMTLTGNGTMNLE